MVIVLACGVKYPQFAPCKGIFQLADGLTQHSNGTLKHNFYIEAVVGLYFGHILEKIRLVLFQHLVTLPPHMLSNFLCLMHR